MNPRIQSALDPATGSSAALIAELSTVLFVGAAIIFLIVMLLALLAVLSGPRMVNSRYWVLGGGVAFPVVTLSGVLIYALAIGDELSSTQRHPLLQLVLDCFSTSRTRALPASPQRLRVHVIGKQWWWEVRYEAPGMDTAIVLANELHLPRNEPVELLLSSTDVIHSFWAPSLAGKVDMIPGRTTKLVLQANDIGVYRGQCAEYCGGQHALMALFIVVESAADFENWLRRQAQPVASIGAEFASKYALFMRGKCHDCHTIRGTSARGSDGPDLTHVGSRSSLAAGVLHNHIGTMAGWIAGPQEVKPGNLMPPSTAYTGRELRELSDWLVNLK